MNHRHLAAILAAATIVTACSNSAKTATPRTVPATTTAVTATTATTATPTTAPPTTTLATDSATIAPTTTTSATTTTATTEPTITSPPDISTTTTPTSAPAPYDWVAVIQRLGQRTQDLYAAPDVSRILEVCGDKTECFDQLNVQLGDLASKGWHVTGADPFVVLSARIGKFDGATLDSSLLVTIVAVVQRQANAGTIVDASGTKIAAVEADTPVGKNTEGQTILARVGPPEDPWRIVSQTRVRDIPA